LLELSNDLLCAAANTLPDDLRKLALKNPDKFEDAMRAFRKTAK
jgi:hypothetical protein